MLVLERKRQRSRPRTDRSAFIYKFTLVFTEISEQRTFLGNDRFQFYHVPFQAGFTAPCPNNRDVIFMCATVLLYTMMNLIQWG